MTLYISDERVILSHHCDRYSLYALAKEVKRPKPFIFVESGLKESSMPKGIEV